MKGALICSDFLNAGRIVADDVGDGYRLERPVVVIDSREVVDGAMFVALPGERTDGHRYVGEVFLNGAAWALVSSEWFSGNGEAFAGPGRRFLVADDPVSALQRLASSYRSRFDIPIVGVGGSNGKTTTKEMVASVLSTKFRVHMSQGNRNNHLGVPLTLLQMREETEIAVVEMGINHPGELELLCDIARPTDGVLTNIGHEHLEFFGTLDGVADAEAALYRHLDAHGGMAFVNADDHRLAGHAAGLPRCVRYALSQADGISWWADAVSTDSVGRVSFTLCSVTAREPVSLQFIGRHNVSNALAAASVGGRFGLQPADIRSGLESLRPAKGWKRMELIEGGGIVVLNDTYNANPDSVKLALDTLAGLDCRGRKIAVIGDMLELGATSAVEHEGIGRYIQQVPIDGLCTFGEMAALTGREAGGISLGHFTERSTLVEFLAGYVRPGDALLFKGSRGMRLELAAESLMTALTQE